MLTRLLNASPGTQTAVAAAMLVLCAGIAVWVAVAVAGGLNEQRNALIETRERAGKLIQFAATDVSQAAVADDPGGTELFMSAPSIVIARADLQQRINAIASAQKSFVASVGNLPDLNEDNTTMIGLRVDFSGAYEDVTKTVLAIETSMPPLIVKELSVRSAGVEQPDRPPELAAQLLVYAPVRTSAAASGEPAND